MKIDRHIHTCYSDGELSLNQLKEIIVETGITDIGVMDHWKTKRYMKSDYYVKDIKEYYDTVKETLSDVVDVKVGLEVDFSSLYGYPITDNDLKEFEIVDYILFEYVDTAKESWGEVKGKSMDELIHIVKGVNTCIGLAHNNFYYNYKNNYDEILDKMRENNIFLELCEGEKERSVVTNSTLKKMAALRKNMSNLDIYNCNKGKIAELDGRKHTINNRYYFEYFPDELWEKIRKTVKVSISTDNHHGKGIAEYPVLESYIEKYQLYDILF